MCRPRPAGVSIPPPPGLGNLKQALVGVLLRQSHAKRQRMRVPCKPSCGPGTGLFNGDFADKVPGTWLAERNTTPGFPLFPFSSCKSCRTIRAKSHWPGVSSDKFRPRCADLLALGKNKSRSALFRFERQGRCRAEAEPAKMSGLFGRDTGSFPRPKPSAWIQARSAVPAGQTSQRRCRSTKRAKRSMASRICSMSVA